MRPLSPSDVLLAQLQTLYGWLQDPSVRHLTKHRREEEQAKGRLPQNVNRNLSAARTKCAQGWGTLLPWERERAVDRLLAAYCRSRASRLGYPDYHKAAEETDKSPYVQVDKLVRAIGVACTRSSSPAALETVQRWAGAFMSAAGLTRVKLERLEPAAQRDLVHEVQVVLAGVKESLHADYPLDDVLLSADDILSRAHDATQPASSRFDKLDNVLYSLIALYHAAPGTEGDVEQLEAARALLSRRMDVGGHPVVLTRRVAEVHFAELSLDQQVAAVQHGRALLFDVCGEYHEQKPLVRASERLDRFFKALQHPELRRRHHPDYSSPPTVAPSWPASIAHGRSDWRISQPRTQQYSL
ncbi:hypothetical protein JCM8208_005821 [Rhodotorula glutinis]